MTLSMQSIRSIQNVRLPGKPSTSTWDIQIAHPQGIIASITPQPPSPPASQSPTQSQSQSNTRALALPPLTHPHIHLDKAFIHSAPQYAHLLPVTGSFAEALSLTTQAKAQFTTEDVLRRGSWLIAESAAASVTAMRAFVEVDSTVKHICISAGATLKERWKDVCEVQLVCFAQDPVFSDPASSNGEGVGKSNREFIESAIERYSSSISVLGSTPYVETNPTATKANIDWAVSLALERNLHLDFHLDYNLDPSRTPQIWYVLESLVTHGWTTRRTSNRVMLGHCTRLTLFGEEEWRRLAEFINQHELPVSFVGLPTSDLYMAAPPPPSSIESTGEVRGVGEVPRGTLPITTMIRDYGLDAVIGVNNVGNAFTPWGSVDPLRLACLGVGVYRAGTQADAELLYECVSSRARAAIGLPPAGMKVGDRADMLLLPSEGGGGEMLARARRCMAEMVWDPPEKVCRNVVCGGYFVGERVDDIDPDLIIRIHVDGAILNYNYDYRGYPGII